MTKGKIKTIAVITPGGDASGMNTAIRAVVRSAIYYKLRIFGIYKGWHGLLTGQIEELNLKSVSGIINHGGTILQTQRTPQFKDKKMREIAYANLAERNIQSLVVIGGDGSLQAANKIAKESDFPVVHIPASIDNDISCTDYTIGFDTAVNTALEAIDKIRDTASSHNRLFVVEVMGRHKGILATEVGLACGAEAIIVPEIKFSIDSIVKRINDGRYRGKTSFIIIVAEGAITARDFSLKLKKKIKKLDIRVSVLGHMQRGGSPTAVSRELACKMGARAVECLIEGKRNIMLGSRSDQINEVSIEKVLKVKKQVDLAQIRLAEMLAI